MLCFLPVVSTIGYDNLLPILIPSLSFTKLLAIQYLIGTLSAPFFLSYANDLFHKESPRYIFFIFIALFGVLFIWQAALFAIGDISAVANVSRLDSFLSLLTLAQIFIIVSDAT